MKRASGQDDSTYNKHFSGDGWVQWLAGNGVVWISSDFSDAGYNSPGEWLDLLEIIIGQIFQARSKKGLVIALWGPETKSLKKKV